MFVRLFFFIYSAKISEEYNFPLMCDFQRTVLCSLTYSGRQTGDDLLVHCSFFEPEFCEVW